MQYKPYATKKDTPSRMARKQARRGTFTANMKMAKARRKTARLLRQQEAAENQ